MDCSADDLRRLTELVRRNFQLLATLADRAHEDLNLTASCRAILEHLHGHGSATVPQIAAAKSVRRQSIQELVDRLIQLGLARVAENPAHRRSQLISMTDKGASLIKQVLRKEQALLRELSAHLGNDIAIQSAIEVLDRLRTTLMDALAVRGREWRKA